MAVDLRSMMGGCLYCGKWASGSSGWRKAFFFSFYLYYIPARLLRHLACISSVSGLTLISLIYPLLRFLYLLLILDRKLLAIVETIIIISIVDYL